MKERLKTAVDEAISDGASYADARYVSGKLQSVSMRNGKTEIVMENEDRGFGIRVLAKGAWGFASTCKEDKKSIKKCVKDAVKIAKASSKVKKENVNIGSARPVDAKYRTHIKKEPFDVPIEEKIEILLEAHQKMKDFEKVNLTEGEINLWKQSTDFLSSEGSFIEQEIYHTGGGVYATAQEGMEVQVRSYPAALGGDYRAAGFEFIEELDLAGNAAKLADEAGKLLKAPQCPHGETDLILTGSQLALQVHESCGHPIELDRVLGMEASYAGTSFLTPEKQGNFKYGSEVVNITADATLEGGLGSFGYDHEGIPAQRTEIVKKGIFMDYLTSRETASKFGRESNASMRADGWNRIPLIRMTNINLEPGDWELEEIIKDTSDGIIMENTRSWSIDEKRINFQFGTEVAYKIKDGSIEGLLRNPTYTGITPEFWGSCDAVANKKTWRLWGIPGCGKGEPMQVMHVGHGASAARFKNTTVGVGKWED